MAEVLTIDGEKMRQEAESTGGVLELDTFVLAQLPGQDPADQIDRNRGLPGDDQVVATYPVTRRAAVDENTVVYSLFLGTDVGPYRFNTLYLCSGNRVHSIVTIPETDKVADDLEHGVRGSNMTRNIVLVFDGAQSLTQISVDAEAWQWDFDQATEVARGLVEIATAEEVQAGTDAERIVTPATLAARLTTVTPPPASADVPGIAELATQEEVQAGTDAARIVTPATLAARLTTVTPPPASADVPGIAELATQEEVQAGTDAARIVTPATLASRLGGVTPWVVSPGMIVMFAGSAKQIPAGWKLCDGQGSTTNGIQVPDLRDRFVLSAGPAHAAGSTGGAESHTTSSAGAHTHGVTVTPATLTVAQMPSHSHRYRNPWATGLPGHQNSDHSGWDQTSAEGGNQPHGHTGSTAAAGAHTHTVETMPPYYALGFIIKL